MTVRESLELALQRTVDELANGDLKPSYTINNQSVDWVRYSEHLMDRAERLQDMIATLGDDDGGIVEEVTQYTT